MMKRSFFTVLFALICTLGFSQVSFNVKAGLNLSSYIGENSDNSKFKPGVRLGVGMEYQFNEMVALQPSLFFSQKGAKYSGDYKGNIADNTNLVIATGPYLACGVGGKAKFDGNASVGSVEVNGSEKVDTFGDDGLDYNRFDAGWNIGLGVEFGQILVGFDTQLGFYKIMDGDAPHNANIGITVGYKF